MTQEILKKAQEFAYTLGIPIYVGSDGILRQNRRDEHDIEVRPGPRAKPVPHGADGPLGKIGE